MTSPHATTRTRRRGLALVITLVVLALATLLGGALIQGIARERRAARDAERQAQADWLVAAGADRARARLAHGDYHGETWNIPTNDLGGRGAARVVIEVADDTDKDKNKDDGGAQARKRVTIRAEFPREELLQARRSRSFTVVVGRPPTGAEP